MTDKQIIIHNVDVSECKKYEHEMIRCNTSLKNMCLYGGRCTDKNNADCYYKQLKRKEQECEELKLEINSYVTITDECLRLDNKRLADEKRDLQQQLDQLKAEVKSKTEYIQEQREIIDQYSEEIRMYKKCQGKRASKREEQLKAENKKIEQCIIEQNRLVVGMTKEIETLTFKKYELLQTLTEIKEIVKNGKRFAERYMVTGEQKANVLIYANAILQKISEVENDR